MQHVGTLAGEVLNRRCDAVAMQVWTLARDEARQIRPKETLVSRPSTLRAKPHHICLLQHTPLACLALYPRGRLLAG
jgi:hypothetical protein